MLMYGFLVKINFANLQEIVVDLPGETFNFSMKLEMEFCYLCLEF